MSFVTRATPAASKAPAVPYRYRPFRYYAVVFVFTWAFWIAAIFASTSTSQATEGHGGGAGPSFALMFLGLCAPAVASVFFVLASGSPELKRDLKRKIIGFHRIEPVVVIEAVALFGAIIAASILASTLIGQPLSQFSFTQEFSFSIAGTSALLTILVASVIEEVGWRGYGEDAIAQYHPWFRESLIFGAVWACWHLPLFFIPGTYHAGLLDLGYGYALNFLVSVVPLGFLTTWVYAKNNRSMLACIVFHLFVNFFQEKVALTPETKCIETAVITAAAVLVVLANRDLFFETRHVGRLLAYRADEGETDAKSFLARDDAMRHHRDMSQPEEPHGETATP